MLWYPDDLSRDIPLFLKFDATPIARPIRKEFGLTEEGAAIAVALGEAFPTAKRVSYSRNAAKYPSSSYRNPLLTLGKVTKAFDQMEGQGLIVHDRRPPGPRGWQSSAMATPEFAEYINCLRANQPLTRLRPQEAIILRDGDKCNIVYSETDRIRRMRRAMETMNETIFGSSILGKAGNDLASPVCRIFNGNFGNGGRIYGQGASWQSLPSQDRLGITIDGEPVVELDFATLHPAMLYADVGAPLPVDCYDLGPWPRSLVKVGLLIALNAKQRNEARLALAHDPELNAHCSGGDQAKIALADLILSALEKRHQPIAQSFFSSASLRLMRRDSDMAMRVIAALNSAGIVALAVHDSFLVPASKRDILEGVMLRVAHEAGLTEIRIRQV